MKTERTTTDIRGRITLPKSFANSPIIIEYVSATEIRIFKAQIISNDEIPIAEEPPLVVSDGDWDRFLDFLDNPPKANVAVR